MAVIDVHVAFRKPLILQKEGLGDWRPPLLYMESKLRKNLVTARFIQPYEIGFIFLIKEEPMEKIQCDTVIRRFYQAHLAIRR